MKRVLLDTSGYSAFMRGSSQAKLALQQAEEILVNPIVLGELFAGFRGGKLREENEQALGKFLSSPRVKVLDIDEDTAEYYAAILLSLKKSGKPIPTNDMWIAASAMQHSLRLLTTDAHYLKVTEVIVDYLAS